MDHLPIDCGELLPGHHVVVLELRKVGPFDKPGLSDIAGHGVAAEPDHMVAVHYVLVPGLTPRELHAGLEVDAFVELRSVSPDGTISTIRVDPPGSLDSRPDLPVTAGAFGPFRCPRTVSEVVVHLRPIQVRKFSSTGGR